MKNSPININTLKHKQRDAEKWVTQGYGVDNTEWKVENLADTGTTFSIYMHMHM